MPNIDGRSTPGTEYVAPRTDLERQIAAIWQELLFLPRIGIKDNFFDLGGSSLLAAHLFVQIQTELGSDLPISSLLPDVTVERIANVINDVREETTICNLAPLETNGSRPPLFFVPGAGSDAIVFRDLSQALGSTQPFYGLQARGLDATKTDKHLTVEDTAKVFVQVIRSIQPHGPYLLGGHCFGCLLAYEIAQQLRQAGENVPGLALLDPTASDSISLEIIGSQKLAYHFGEFLRLPWWKKWGYIVTRIRNFSRTLIMRQRIRGSYKQAEAMHRGYRLQPYDGPLACFVASDSFHGLDPKNDPRRSWQKLATTVSYVEIKGDHHTILHQPAVQELAHKLGTYFQQMTGQEGERV